MCGPPSRRHSNRRRRPPIRIAIFGVGALGCLFGARLTPHADLTLVGHWPEQIAALRRGPLRIAGTETHISISVTDDPASLPNIDIALILTKAAGTQRAAREAATILAPDGIAITLQNGLGNLEIVAEAVGAARAIQGVTAMGASTRGEPGVLYPGGSGPTHLAATPTTRPRVDAFAALLRQAGLETHVVEDVAGLMWGKLVINAAINPLTALLRCPNGALLGSSWARDLLHDAARETAAIAAAQSITLPYPDPVAQVDAVARATATNHSSMLSDVLRGAPTEIDTINGAVLRAGEAAGIPAPVNALLYRMVKALENSATSRVR